MTMNMAIYVSMGILTIWAFTMLAWEVWSKKQEDNGFSFVEHIRNLKMSRAQYEHFANSARFMMYLYAFLTGMALGKCEISMVISSGTMFLGLQILLVLIRIRWVSKFR